MTMFGRDPAGGRLEDEVATIRASLGRIARTLATTAEERITRDGGDGLAGLAALAERWMTSVRRDGDGAIRAAARGAEPAMEPLDAQIARHPLAAIGIAAAVGFALGLAASGGTRRSGETLSERRTAL